MAPKRKPRDAGNSPSPRRSSRLANAAVAPPVPDPQPRKKKKSLTPTAAPEKEEEVEVSAAAADEKEEEPEPESPEEEKLETGAGKKSIVIEHCKQCNSFKTRAIQVKVGLEKAVDGVSVAVNPEKPRKGCFEIREEGGGVFVSLLEMKRPFKAMKDLDMDKVISDIVEKIK